MISVDDVTKEKITEHNPNWSQNSRSTRKNINNWRLRIWKKKNSLFNLISHQPDIDKICSYAEGEYGAKCQQLINKRETPD